MDIIKIPIGELEVGMFVSDVYNGQGVKLLSANSIITSDRQIQLLRRQGVENVRIDTRKGLDVSRDESAVQEADDGTHTGGDTEYFQELEKAQVIVNQTLGVAKDMMGAIRQGRQFSTEPVEEASGDIVGSILRNRDALTSLCQIKGYDEYTFTHSVNVAVLATVLASLLGYDHDQLVRIGMGGMLHDIGKMQIPESLLNRPRKLSNLEFRIMMKHPELGLEIVNGRQDISDVSKTMIIQHHERCDGSGYPFNLKAGEIDEVGLIAAVADVYDAMTSDRVYRAACTPQKALAHIFQGADAEYSRQIVETFTRQMGIYPVGSFVKLSSGEMGVVTRMDQEMLLKPTVLALFDADENPYAEPVEYDLAEKEAAGEDLAVIISINPKLYGVTVAEYINGKI